MKKTVSDYMRRMKIPQTISWIIVTGLFFILLMSMLRLALFLSFVKPQLSSHSLVASFVLGLRYDLRMVCSAMLLFLLLSFVKPLSFFASRSGKKLGFAVWALAILFFSFMYVVDFAHYAYLSQRLNASVLNYLYNIDISFKMVWSTYHVIWILLGMGVFMYLLFSLIRFSYHSIAAVPVTTTRLSRILWKGGFFILLGVGIFGRLGQFPLRWSDAVALSNDYTASLSLNPFESFFSTMGFRHASYDLAKTEKGYPLIADYFQLQKKDSLNYTRCVNGQADSTAQVRPNVVLVICESFSAYKSSMYGNPLNTTPYFKELCDKGVFFDRCFTPSYGTARGVWSVVTGIPDVELLNTSSRNFSYVDQHSIINDFAGYEKYYFLGGSASWANIRGVLTNNIENLHLYEQDNYKAKKVDVWGISDKNLLLSANQTLSQEKHPFFAVIQTADNHRPYTIPEEDRKDFTIEQVPNETLAKYGFSTLDEFNAFRYTDYCFQKFMKAAEKAPYFKNTIFVFVGDHGIPGDAGDMFPKAWTSLSLTAEHVPLLFYSPALLNAKRYSFIASQVDVMPTIAGLCRIPYCNTTLGKDLLDKEQLAKDSGAHNVAFIFDPNLKRVGILHKDSYYTYGLQKGTPEQFSSIVDNKPIQLTDSTRTYFHNL
ncbi:MAG: sulfatase-like hydrolase/transferase, partial [Bacteroidota bacterium]|nr:sulfatase-like hydrolase/transferase [Bacteroidota bacterium]